MGSSILHVQRTNLKYLLDLIKDDVKREINCHAVGTIQSFDSTTLTCTVSFNYRKVLKKASSLNPNDGSYIDVIIEYPQLVRVPVVIMGGGGAYTSYPIAQGDTCLIMFCDRDIDLWLELGGVQSQPNSERLHDLSDAVALIGISPVTNPIVKNYNSKVISSMDKTGERLCQAGFLQPYAGSIAPSGWLLCYGQAVSRTAYDVLFAVIGTTYGTGNGSTTFNVPDLRGRTVAGLDNMGGSDADVLTNAFTPSRNTLGGKPGEEAHKLTIAELAKHLHTIFFTVTGNTGLGTFEEGAGPPNYTMPSGDSGTYSGTSANTGNDSPHYNVQPTMMINWIIKI